MASQRQTIGDMAKRKSENAVTKTVENSIYDIVSQYNGIVDKLIEATQADGRYQTKRMLSQSSISYLANVLKGLLEPAKHIMSEISTVRDPGTATLFNMMKNMVKVIDDCPPFQKIDVRVYRNGKPNYEAFNKNLPIEDFKGTIKNLEASREELRTALKQLYKDTTYINATLKGEDDKKYREMVFKNIKEKEKGIKEALAQSNADIKAVKQRETEGRTYPNDKYNAARGLITNTKAVVEAADAAQPTGKGDDTVSTDAIGDLINDTKVNLDSIHKQLDNIVANADKEGRTFDEEEAAIVETLEATTNQISAVYDSLDTKVIVGNTKQKYVKRLFDKIDRDKVHIKQLLDKFSKINQVEIQKEQAEAQGEAQAEGEESGEAGGEDSGGAKTGAKTASTTATTTKGNI